MSILHNYLGLLSKHNKHAQNMLKISGKWQIKWPRICYGNNPAQWMFSEWRRIVQPLRTIMLDLCDIDHFVSD